MKQLFRLPIAVTMALSAAAAHAHPGHGYSGLAAGLAHPLAPDHLLTMLAVGGWSALALRGPRALLGPLAFIAAMLAGASLGAGDLGGALLESLLAAGLAVIGLVLTAAGRVPVSAGLALATAAGWLHGVAHGAELPADVSLAGYTLGFLVATTLLQACGLLAGRSLRDAPAAAARAVGAMLGAAGLLMLAIRL